MNKVETLGLAAVAAFGLSCAADAGFPKEAFVTPPSEVSPGYFWMWNTKLTPEKIRSQLDDMAKNGVKSVCIHPFPRDFRPGYFIADMEPDYLTPGYLEMFKVAIDHAAKLGMTAWLYDEGGWPSGGACTLVAKSDAEGRWRQRFIGYGADGAQPFGVRAQEYGTGRASYPSMIEPGATERFIELTHDRYAKTLGDHLGKTVRFTFMDEPDHPHDFFHRQLGWTSDFPEQFKARKGYDIMPYVKDLIERKYDDVDEKLVRVRIDYYDVIGDLFVERFMLPLRDWGRRHGVLSSGHLNGEDVPEFSTRYGHGPLLKCYRAMDLPGVDTIWRQLYPSSYANEGRQLPFPRYAASAAHQNGQRLVLSESCGIYGDSMTPAQLKWLMDYQMVRGVNVFVFCYYAMTNAKQWLTLFELHSGPVVPYWEFERPFFDYIARTSALLSSGKPAAEIAVYFDEPGFRAGGSTSELTGDLHYLVAKALERKNCDYDFVDDEQIAEAKIENGRLVVGAMRYSTVVLPTSKWMRESAKAKIEAFRAAGGTVLTPETVSAAKPTMRIDGRLRTELRVAKRTCGDETLYFVANESRWPFGVTLNFAEKGEVVRCDPETGRYVATPTANGRLDWQFEPFGSALFLVGAKADAEPVSYAGSVTNELASGWTLRKTVEHAVGKEDFVITACDGTATAVELGDWRPVLGKHFSGKAVYRTEFESSFGGRALLDLGQVCWACGVRLNGEEVGKKFFGPYRFDVSVKKGRNVLEVTVANTLANAISDDAVRDRIARDFPPKSGYDIRQRPFDRENNESGLFGPVQLISAE